MADQGKNLRVLREDASNLGPINEHKAAVYCNTYLRCRVNEFRFDLCAEPDVPGFSAIFVAAA